MRLSPPPTYDRFRNDRGYISPRQKLSYITLGLFTYMWYFSMPASHAFRAWFSTTIPGRRSGLFQGPPFRAAAAAAAAPESHLLTHVCEPSLLGSKNVPPAKKSLKYLGKASSSIGTVLFMHGQKKMENNIQYMIRSPE